MIDEVVAGYVTAATAEGFPEEWDLDKLWKAFKQLYPISITADELIEDRIRSRAYDLYLQRNGGAGSEIDDWLQAERELLGRERQEND